MEYLDGFGDLVIMVVGWLFDYPQPECDLMSSNIGDAEPETVSLVRFDPPELRGEDLELDYTVENCVTPA